MIGGHNKCQFSNWPIVVDLKVDLWNVAAASLGSLLKMQILGYYPGPAESETQRGPAIPF